VLDVLDIDPQDYARNNVMQPIHRFRIGMMGQEAVENDHGSEPVSYGIRRCEFDHYLLERSGSERAEGVKFKSLERTDNGEWCLNGDYQAPLVIGAGGLLLPGGLVYREGPGSHENSGHRQGSGIRDDARAERTLPGARGHARTLVLPRPHGLCLDLPARATS